MSNLPSSSNDPQSLEDLLNSPGASNVDVSARVRNAAQHVKEGNLGLARREVNEILTVTKNNADAWYLFGYLSENPTEKRQAVQRALQLNPQHKRAQELLANLGDDDPFNDMPPAAGTQNRSMGAQGQPVVYVNVNQANANLAMAGSMAPRAVVNQTALLVGFLVAFFTGIFGVAHLVNGKGGGFVKYFLMGIAWAFLAVFLTVITAGLFGCLALPLHIYLAYNWSKEGATSFV
jgi:TM2 domain-containing membrane protein YozV